MRVLPLGILIGFVAGIAFAEMVRADTYCADYGYTVQCSGTDVQAWGYRTPYGKSFTIRPLTTFKPGAYGGSVVDRHSWERSISQPMQMNQQLLPGLDW